MKKVRVLHVISSLGSGGAEATLVRLIAATGDRSHVVVSLTPGGKHVAELESRGIPVHQLSFGSVRLAAGSLRKLWRLLRELEPDVIQTWMYHSDLIGGSLARASGRRSVVWGVRNGYVNADTMSFRTRMVVHVCAIISRCVPRAIVAASEVSAREHVSLGYPRRLFRVIQNGYDATLLCPDASLRSSTRDALGVAPTTRLIGMVGRWDPQKDHRTLFAALRLVANEEAAIPWHLALFGPGMTADNYALTTLIAEFELGNRLTLAGATSNVRATMNALDIHVLSSRGEAFPNVVAEAMACGTPVIVTDVGDAAYIAGDTGWVVPPQSPTDLSDAIRHALALSADVDTWEERRRRARERIVTLFSTARMADAYRDVWDSTAR